MAAISVADKAIANAALTVLFMEAIERATGDRNPETAILLAADFVESASRVNFQPSTRQLVVKFDLAFGEEPSDG